MAAFIEIPSITDGQHIQVQFAPFVVGGKAWAISPTATVTNIQAQIDNGALFNPDGGSVTPGLPSGNSTFAFSLTNANAGTVGLAHTLKIIVTDNSTVQTTRTFIYLRDN
jgi:hypothetical protein